MALKNLFDMVKADRYTADGREAIIKAQEAETEDKVYQIGEISQKTGLQKTANGWVKPKNSAGRNHGTEQKKRGPGAIHTPGKGSVGIDKMKEAAEKGLKGQELKEFMTGAKTGESKPAVENKTTVRQGPKTKTLNETPAEHVQKNLDAYTGYNPYDMEELVLKPSGYEKSRSTKGPDGVSSITYKKDGGDDIILFFDKYGELKNAGTSQNRESVMQKMRAAEGYGHMKVVGDYDVYRVTSGPDKGKYKVSKVGSLREVTMSEEKAADFLTSAAGKNKTANKDSAPSLSEIVDRVYNIGEISEKTGLQKTANGWRPVKKGAAGKTSRANKEEAIRKDLGLTAGEDMSRFSDEQIEKMYAKTQQTPEQQKADFDKSKIGQAMNKGRQEFAAEKTRQKELASKTNAIGLPKEIKPALSQTDGKGNKVEIKITESKGGGFYVDKYVNGKKVGINNANTRESAEAKAKSMMEQHMADPDYKAESKPAASKEPKLKEGVMNSRKAKAFKPELEEIRKTDPSRFRENLMDILSSWTDENEGYLKNSSLTNLMNIYNYERNQMYETGDAAPRVLTGDCRIRIRKEKPALTGDTKIRVRK